MEPSIQKLIADANREGPAGIRAVARLISLIENEPHRAPEILALGGNSAATQLILGITGPPGAGKSTLIDALISATRRRHPSWRIAVIAVDPTSPSTGGAVLGDRARMMRHAGDPKVFIRSLASRGRLGGLTSGARGVVAVLSLLRFDLIVIETVGVGQNEVDIAQVADLTAVVIAPGMGDDLQLLKAGLLEVADLFVVNKADRPGADELLRQLLSWRRLSPEDHPSEPASDSPSDLFIISATAGTGLEALMDALEHLIAARAHEWRERRATALARHVQDAIVESASRRVRQAAASNGAAEKILAGTLRLNEAVDDVLRRAREGEPPAEPRALGGRGSRRAAARPPGTAR